eukprot:5826810-Alexandrium_andersonii.AAC.1
MAPSAYGPSGAVGGYRRAPGVQAQEPPQVSPETAREFKRASRGSGWQGGLASAFSRSASASG